MSAVAPIESMNTLRMYHRLGMLPSERMGDYERRWAESQEKIRERLKVWDRFAWWWSGLALYGVLFLVLFGFAWAPFYVAGCSSMLVWTVRESLKRRDDWDLSDR